MSQVLKRYLWFASVFGAHKLGKIWTQLRLGVIDKELTHTYIAGCFLRFGWR